MCTNPNYHPRTLAALLLGAVLACFPAGCASAKAEEPSDKDIVERILADLTLKPMKVVAIRAKCEDGVPAIEAVARRLDLTVAQRSGRAWLLFRSPWYADLEKSLWLPLNGRYHEKLARMEDKDLLDLIRPLVEKYDRTKEQQDELNRAEIRLNKLVTSQTAQAVFNAEKYFGDSDDGKQLRKHQEEVRTALRKVLNANPDLKKKLKAALAAERSGVSKELQESRRQADEVLTKARKKPEDPARDMVAFAEVTKGGARYMGKRVSWVGKEAGALFEPPDANGNIVVRSVFLCQDTDGAFPTENAFSVTDCKWTDAAEKARQGPVDKRIFLVTGTLDRIKETTISSKQVRVPILRQATIDVPSDAHK